MDISLWEVIPGKLGLKPKFRILCSVCKVSRGKEVEMVIRFSALTTLETVSPDSFACNMYYKCPECDKTEPFGVAIPKAYYDELYERRGGQNYTPHEEWKEFEKIQKKLESLGYW